MSHIKACRPVLTGSDQADSHYLSMRSCKHQQAERSFCSLQREGIKNNFSMNENYLKILHENLPLIFSMSRTQYSICKNKMVIFPSGTLFIPSMPTVGFQDRVSCLLFFCHKGSQFPVGPLGASVMLIMLILIILLVANLAHFRLK